MVKLHTPPIIDSEKGFSPKCVNGFKQLNWHPYLSLIIQLQSKNTEPQHLPVSQRRFLKPEKRAMASRPKKKKPEYVTENHPLRELAKREVPINRWKKSDVSMVVRDCHVILTPVNVLRPSTVFSVMAKHDYIRESEKFHHGRQLPLWDDTSKNSAKIGDKFFFVTIKLNKEEI